MQSKVDSKIHETSFPELFQAGLFLVGMLVIVALLSMI